MFSSERFTRCSGGIHGPCLSCPARPSETCLASVLQGIPGAGGVGGVGLGEATASWDRALESGSRSRARGLRAAPASGLCDTCTQRGREWRRPGADSREGLGRQRAGRGGHGEVALPPLSPSWQVGAGTRWPRTQGVGPRRDGGRGRAAFESHWRTRPPEADK